MHSTRFETSRCRFAFASHSSSMSRPTLHTARTVLRPMNSADIAAVHALWTMPEVRRFLFDDRVISDEDTRSFLEASDTAFRDHGYGVWLASATGGGALIGFAG